MTGILKPTINIENSSPSLTNPLCMALRNGKCKKSAHNSTQICTENLPREQHRVTH